jgi:hypothetical protein
MRKLIGIILSVLVIVPLEVLPANASFLSDCIYVSSAKFNKTSFETSYSVTLNSRCDSNTSRGLDYSGISFYADRSVINPIRATYYYNSWGVTQKFVIPSWDLARLAPGVHYPTLRIFTPKDYSNSTISLPSFTTNDPLSCISADLERVDSSFNPVKIEVGLKNICSDLSGSDFSGYRIQLLIPGYYSGTLEQSIYSLNTYFSTYSFQAWDLKAGFYIPSLEIIGSNSQRKTLSLDSFDIRGKSKVNSPNSSSTNTKSKKIYCSYAPGFEKQCEDWPSFTFDLCSPLQNSNFEQKISGKWVFLWKIKGTRDSEKCTDPKVPFYAIAQGESKITGVVQFRLVFQKNSKATNTIQPFTLKPS